MIGDFQLGEWLVQPAAGLISRDGKDCKISPKAMAVLEVLVEADGNVVSRQALIDTVWSDQIVSDDLLTTCISTLRRHLGDKQDGVQYIQTLPKRGYRLLVAAESLSRPVTEPNRKTPATRRWFGLLLALFTAATPILWQWMDRRPVKPPQLYSIAVLPFDVYSEEKDFRHFADGLTEELIHQLAADPSRRVIARTSSFKFRDGSHSIAEIAKTLNVRHVLEGSVRAADSGMRITIQLIDTSNDFHIWSRVFDVGHDNLFKVQKEVGMAVARLIPTKNSKSVMASQSRHPVPDEAYRLYLLGKSQMHSGTVDAYARAAELFAEAVTIAPDYALAYSQLAAAYMLLYQYRHDPLEEASSRASVALKRALEIAPEQAEAYAVSGLLNTYLKNFPAAEENFLHAVELRPKFTFARHNFGFMLWSQSRYEEALVHLRIAHDSDPLSAARNFLVGDSLAGLGRFEEAIDFYENCQRSLPEYSACLLGPATVEQLRGDYKAAETLLKKADKLEKRGGFWWENVAAALAIHQGHYNQARELLATASAKAPRDYSLLKSRLLLSLKTGELENFIKELEKLSAENTTDPDLRLITAAAAYFASDCDKALAIYKQEMLSNEAFLFNYWDLDTGFSHLGNLSFCLAATGQEVESANMQKRLQKHLDQKQTSKLPGGIYAQARLHHLNGRETAAGKYFEQLRDMDWGLLWLTESDPAFKNRSQQIVQ